MTALEPTHRPGAAEVAAQLRARPAPADPTRVLPEAGPSASFLDRPAQLVRRAAELDAHVRGVAASVAALVLLIVVVAIAADTDSDAAGTDDGLPRETPSELREPLQDLHDAVNGG
jgi:hypothetical protein